TRAQYEFLPRRDLATFAGRCFQDLNPQTSLAMNWHLEVIAAKLTEVRQGRIQRLIINLPPRHLKSLLASIAFPAWCLGHDPSAQILCVSYAQELADKLARDCRSIMMSPWYRQIFPTRLAPHRQAVQEFITTRQGDRRSRRGARDRDDRGAGTLHPAARRGVAPRARAARHPRAHPPHHRRVQFRWPVSAIPGTSGWRAGQGNMVQALRRARAARAL